RQGGLRCVCNVLWTTRGMMLVSRYVVLEGAHFGADGSAGLAATRASSRAHSKDAINGVCSLDDDAPVMRPSAHMAPYPSRPDRPRRRTGRARGVSLLLLIPLIVGIIGGSASPVGADELSDARARQS